MQDKRTNTDREAPGTQRASSFAELYRSTFKSVYNYLYFRTLNHSLSEDLAAETYTRAWRAFDRFDPQRAKFSTWIITIAHNVLVDHWKKHHETESVEVIPERLVATEDSYAGLNENGMLVRRLLGVLSDDERELVFMRFWQNMHNNEIAKVLGVKPSTVGTRLHRAVKKMRAVEAGQ